jgi:hypothetical protein
LGVPYDKRRRTFDAIMNLIICESTGDWATAIRRRLPEGVSLIETRSLPELNERLGVMPSALVAVEWNADKAEELLAELARMNRKHPGAMLVVLGDRRLCVWDAAVRETGAVHCVASRRRVGEIIEIARHRLRSGSWTEGESDASARIEDRILAGLPWSS